MRTISLKIPESLDRELDKLAAQRHTTRSAVLREALSSLTKQKKRSAADLAGELVGSLQAAPDLSTNPSHMQGYGE
jgi:predicted transcriptional regulator